MLTPRARQLGLCVLAASALAAAPALAAPAPALAAATASASPQASADQVFTGTVSATGTKFVAEPFSVTAPETISATLTWQAQPSGSSAQLVLFLKNPSGQQVASATSPGTSQTLTYAATTTGTYKFGVKAKSGAASFSLDVTTGSGGGNTAPAYVKTIGGPAHPGMGPSGIDVDRTSDSMSGDLFVADTANSQVAAYNASGTQLWRVGREGSKANGNFLNPRDVAYGGGSVYVADTGNNRIQVLNAATGAWERTFSFHFQGVMGVSYGVDGSGNPIVLAADSPRSVIDIFSTAGALLHTYGAPGAGSGQFNQARDAATDPAGNIYVADFKNERVEVLSASGAYKGQWGTKCPYSGCTAPGQFKDPYGITLDAAGHVYVSDNIRIQEFTTGGTFIAQFGQTCPQGGCTGNELFQLRRVAVGPGSSPNVFAADLWGYKVVEYNQAGTVVQVFGNTKPATGGFNQPFGETLNGSTLSVVDTNNQRVETFNASTGAYVGTWAHRGYGATDLDGVNWPRAITWNAATSTYWVADTKNYRLTQHNPDGSATGKVIGTTGPTLQPSILNWTYGVTSYNGDVISADTFNNRVEEWDGTSSTTPVWTATGMKAPEGVAVAGNTVYVADTNNARIVTLSATTGAQTGTFGAGHLGHPDGVAVDPAGNVWVADAGKNQLVEFSSSGTLLQTFGSLGSGNSQFFGPSALAIGPGSSGGTWLYVVDTNNDRVQVFGIDGSGGAVSSTGTSCTGTVDSTKATGPAYAPCPVNVPATGAMNADLTWSGGATLKLFLKDPTGKVVAQTGTSTTGSLSLSTTASTTGRWVYGVKAVKGAASYTLSITVPSGGGGGSPLTYNNSYGYNGHDKELYAYGMAYDPANQSVLVGDLWNYRVLDYTANGDNPKLVSTIAPRGAPGGMGAPFGLVADSSGDVWVADQSNSRVVEFSPSGKWMQTLGYGGSPSYGPGCGNGHMTIPTHLAISGSDIYVSDPRCGQVYIWTLSGSYVGQFNWSGTGVANPIPRGMAVAGGHVYVSEFNTRKIYEFTTTGTFVTGGASQLAPNNAMADVRGITYDPSTNTLFAVGAEWNYVVQFSLSGQYISSWGATTARPFDAIRFITADPNGNLYVSDTFGYRVWKLSDTTGAVESGTNWTAQPPPAGSFNQNNGIAVTPGNKLYVVDSFNNLITEFDASKSCTSQTNCSAFVSSFGSRGPLSKTSCNLDYPHAISYDPNNGYLYTDATNAILEWESNNNNVCAGRWGSHGQSVGQFSNGPQGIDVAPDWTNPSQTDVYTTDVNTARLQVFTESGTLVASMGSSGSGTDQMSGPRQLAVLGNYAYVADTGHGRIDIWNLSTKSIVGTISGPFGGTNLKLPKGVAIDPTHTWLYIADSGNDRIVRVDIAANPTAPTNYTVASTGSDTPLGKFAGPEWLTFGPDGRLFVSDNSQVVYAFTVSG